MNTKVMSLSTFFLSATATLFAVEKQSLAIGFFDVNPNTGESYTYSNFDWNTITENISSAYDVTAFLVQNEAKVTNKQASEISFSGTKLDKETVYFVIPNVSSYSTIEVSFTISALRTGSPNWSYGFITPYEDFFSGNIVNSTVGNNSGSNFSVSPTKKATLDESKIEAVSSKDGVVVFAVSFSSTSYDNTKIKNISISATPIPEPSAFSFLVPMGVLVLVGARRRKQ